MARRREFSQKTFSIQSTVPNVRSKIYILRCCTAGTGVRSHVSKDFGISLDMQSSLLQVFATFVFATIPRILQPATEKFHEATSLSLWLSNHIAKSSTSSLLSPVQFRILFFGDEGSRSLLFAHVQEVSPT
jgi:hypothetical protein